MPRGVKGLQCCQGWASPRQGKLNSAWPVAPTTPGSVPPLTSPGEQCKSLSCLPSATLSLESPALGPSPLLTLTTERERERNLVSSAHLPPSRAQSVEQALLEHCCWSLQVQDTEMNKALWLSQFPFTAQSAGACRPATVLGWGGGAGRWVVAGDEGAKYRGQAFWWAAGQQKRQEGREQVVWSPTNCLDVTFWGSETASEHEGRGQNTDISHVAQRAEAGPSPASKVPAARYSSSPGFPVVPGGPSEHSPRISNKRGSLHLSPTSPSSGACV